MLLAVRELLDGEQRGVEISLCYDSSMGQVNVLKAYAESADLRLDAQGRWMIRSDLEELVAHTLQFYLPILGTPNDRSCVVAHLGQSVDAQIATTQGDSYFVTGPENRKHLHCLRALCHAVVVGAGTVSADDPQLTTRAVEGISPVRVVIDPQARTPCSSGVFNDKQALTLLVHDETVELSDEFNRLMIDGWLEAIPLRFDQQSLFPSDFVNALAKRGLTRLFIEGGGVTISRFMQAGCIDRLQIASAPVLVGEGRDSLRLPGVDVMVDALRPPFKLYRMGDDVLWDFALSSQAQVRQQQILFDNSASLPGKQAFARLL